MCCSIVAIQFLTVSSTISLNLILNQFHLAQEQDAQGDRRHKIAMNQEMNFLQKNQTYVIDYIQTFARVACS